MANSKYMTGEEFVDKKIARMLKFHPIAVWRAKKFVEKMDEVMKDYPEIKSFVFCIGKVFCFDHSPNWFVPPACKAVAVFKFWVVNNPIIIEKIFELYGFRCSLSEIAADHYDTYYYIERYDDK